MSSVFFFSALSSAGALALFMLAYSCIAGIGGGTKDQLGLGNSEWLATWWRVSIVVSAVRCLAAAATDWRFDDDADAANGVVATIPVNNPYPVMTWTICLSTPHRRNHLSVYHPVPNMY
ncbi:hypothetical protein M422DRAFT_36642 [Sphaerobolus stellatus SS14]|uniref:Uncharacterized protein n=1 Tax=Sphaerobolus stellatus (strain SS14) TaxID=990650 RepID=A0A0C9TKI5_SPHS4|nr:hypothetical protein M422DRAFT_36642 [Sphaerobolus stellatus SS14]